MDTREIPQIPKPHESLLPQYLLRERNELERVSRQNAQTAYLGDNRMLTRVLGKYFMYVDTTDINISPYLAMDGYWEAWTTLAMARILRPGMRCLDVGANFGYYSVLMGDAVGDDGVVVALEPNPKVTLFLDPTIKVNGLEKRVTILEKAAYSQDDANLNFVVPKNSPMNGAIGVSASKEESLTVGTTTLDTLTRNWDRVDFAKIDTEGAEWDVWKGMQQMIDRNPNISIIMEFNSSRGYDTELFLNSIRAKEFPIRHIDNNSRFTSVSDREILSSNQDWLLYLHR